MKVLYLYILLLCFSLCLLAPSAAVLSHLKVKENKVAKLFDMEEEEDARDADSKTEKENDTSGKFFKDLFIAVIIPECFSTSLSHNNFYQYYITEPVQELVTPPPRG